MDIINKDGYILTDHELKQTIKDIAQDNNIDLTSCSNSQFNYVLKQTGAKYFYNNNILYNNYYLSYNLDIDILYTISDFYISICLLYNKITSVLGFSYLCCISNENILLFQGEDVTSKKYKLYKNLTNTRENNIKDKCLDSNNIVGAIAVANNEYKWSNTEGAKSTTINILTNGQELPGLLEGLKTQDIKTLTAPSNNDI